MCVLVTGGVQTQGDHRAMHWIYSVPLFPLGVLISLVFVTVGVAGMWLTHRHVRPRLAVRQHHTEFTAVIIEGILIIYGLAIALILISVWENYAEASKLVSNEATAIAMLYRDSGAYPEPTRARLQEELRGYTDYVVNEAWPEQRRGGIPIKGVAWMNRLQDELFKFEPTTESQKILHAEAIHTFNHLIEARRLRMDAVRSGMPASMWVVVILGALISLTASFLFEVDSSRLHYAMVGLLACLMGLVVFLILCNDAPFRGTHGVDAEPYELIRTQLMDL
jgi:lipid-A-disaccharide synthase-like uncharacterized protein